MRRTSLPVLTVPILVVLGAGTAFAQGLPGGEWQPAIDRMPNEFDSAFNRAVSLVPADRATGDATRLPAGPGGVRPGAFTVAWHVTSADRGGTDGAYHLAAAATDAPGISLTHVWARATPGASTTAAAYFTVTSTSRADHLLGVSTPVAAAAGLHETTDDNGVMKMRPVASIALEPGKPVAFTPGGYHVMLTGLKSALKAGDSFPLTLTFEHAAPVTVTVKVEAMGGAAMDHGHGDMPDMPGH